MKIEIVKVNNGYAARYKRWYSITWWYIGINEDWSRRRADECYVKCYSIEHAERKIKHRFPVINKLNNGVIINKINIL